VHVVPHSHDDVGWLKTVDEYFYGGAQNIQYAAVQHTIDSVVDELAEHEEYKFVQVEMAFLYRWWHQATPQQQQTLKKLVQDGQFQFLNAGWCMSDEATVYYEDFIDQMTLGLKWLKDTFNYVPDVAWHIDPFGHQAAAASMLAQMGFQTFFFARIDYQDMEKRLDEKGMEMIWRPST
jgi:alpha-mannosidase